MNDIRQSELEAVLAVRARGLDVGPAPVEATLAGARRRVTRRRAVTAVVGVIMIAGAAGGLGMAFRGSHSAGIQQVPPGQRSSPPDLSNPSASGSPRHIPAFTQEDGQGDVAASGTEDGVPWQVLITDRVGSDGGRTIGMVLKKGGALAESTTNGVGPVGAGGLTEAMTLTAQGLDSEWVFLVPSNITDVAWTGTDGFRHDQATLPARSYGPLGDLRLAVFPSSRMNARLGDEFVGYDANGRQVAVLGAVLPPVT